MTYYQTCPLCGSSLDPDERCDCQDKEEAAPDAANIGSGKVESESPNAHSTFDFNKGSEENQA